MADVNLRVLPELRRRFDVLVGLSDHTTGSLAAVAAVALGAVLIEKHVTLDRALRGTDHACSLDVPGWAALVRDVRSVERALGNGVKGVPESVQPAQARLGRSLVSQCCIPRGRRLKEEMLCLKSGGPGLKWRQRNRIVGRIARRDIPADVTLSERDFY
jgi:sialic acid synthase SpsE